MVYIDDFFSRYSDQADQMIDIVPKIVNIIDPDPKFERKKREVLRKSLKFIENLEIIDTVANLYVDMVCGITNEGSKELITNFIQNLDMKHSVFDEKLL